MVAGYCEEVRGVFLLEVHGVFDVLVFEVLVPAVCDMASRDGAQESRLPKNGVFLLEVLFLCSTRSFGDRASLLRTMMGMEGLSVSKPLVTMSLLRVTMSLWKRVICWSHGQVSARFVKQSGPAAMGPEVRDVAREEGREGRSLHA